MTRPQAANRFAATRDPLPQFLPKRYMAHEVSQLFCRAPKDAFAMAKDAIESLVFKKGFKVQVYEGKEDTFTVDSHDRTTLRSMSISSFYGRFSEPKNHRILRQMYKIIHNQE